MDNYALHRKHRAEKEAAERIELCAKLDELTHNIETLTERVDSLYELIGLLMDLQKTDK